MALIHENSCACVGSQLDLFSVPGTQTSQEKNTYVPHYPISSLNGDGPIEFDIKPSSMYTDLGDTRLYLRCRIVKSDGTAIPTNKPVAAVNMLFHALIQRLDVHVGNTLITQSGGFYCFKAAIETLLNFGTDAKTSQLGNIMYVKDDYNADTNPAALARQKIGDGSKSFQLYGPLHVDLFFQDKYLISNVPMRVKITRSSANFYLLSTVNYACKLEISEAVLWVRRVQIAPSIELAHARAMLAGKNALYPLRRGEIEVMSVPAFQQTVSRDNLFMSKLPKKLIIGLMNNSNFSGALNQHPFEFDHFHANNIEVSIDGENVCGTPMQLDYTDQKYMRAYDGLFHALNKSYNDVGLDITYNDFPNGYCLYCFDLTADGCGNTSSHLELSRQGNLRFKMTLARPLASTINVIIYGEFESMLEITNSREVLLDYKN